MENIIPISIKHLKSKSYHFPHGWVEACLEWLFQEHKDDLSSMSNDKWCYLIEQQWLFTDLRDLETSNLFTISDHFMKYNGVMCCQVMSFKVVSKSFYSQIRETTGTINENALVTDETDAFHTQSTSSNRSLLLNLTDGINNFEAFEFEGWNLIDISNVVIGCKCRLKGPFIIRRRIALLRQQNIEILGGEVEDLSSVSQLSFLREKLEFNTNKRKNHPIPIKSESKVKATRLKNKQSTETIVNNSLDFKPPNLPKENLKIKPKIENFPPISSNFSNNESLQVPKPNNHSSTELGNYNYKSSYENISDLHLSDWIKNSNEINSFSNDIPQVVENFDEEGEELFLNIPLDELTNEIDIEKSIKTEDISLIQPDIKKENPCSSTEKPFDKSEPFVYLVDVFNELSQPDAENILDKQFKIKGLIFTFVSKLKIVEDANKLFRWDLQILLGDGTATVDCFLADEFITKEIGFTAQHFQEMKKSKSIDNLKKSFIDFQTYIVKCNCGLFTLQICEGYDKLCVVDYQSVDENTVKALQNRISQTNK